MRKETALLAAVFLLFAFSSCTKQDQDLQPSFPQDQQVDSTFLIKSLYYELQDWNEHSWEEYYYDTLSRKLTVDLITSYDQDSMHSSFVIEYNSDSLVSHILRDIPAAYLNSAPETEVEFWFSYDAKGRLKQFKNRSYAGIQATYDFTATDAPDGTYAMKWKEYWEYTINEIDTIQVTAGYSADNRLLGYQQKLENISSSSLSWRSTSVAYEYSDPLGVSSEKMSMTSANNPAEEWTTMVQYNSRSTEGTQLYELRSLLMRGFENIPSHLFSGISGSLSIFPDQGEQFQYCGTPFTSATFREVSGSSEPTNIVMTADVTIDSKHRLTSFHGGVLRDYGMPRKIFELRYYKD